TGTGPSPAGTPSFEEPPPSRSAGDLKPGEDQKHETPGWVRTLAFLINVAAAVLVVYLLVRYAGRPLLSWTAIRFRPGRRGRRGGDDETALTLLDAAHAGAR